MDELVCLRQSRGLRVLLVGLMSLALVALTAYALGAQELIAGPPDLSSSSKDVDAELAEPGEQLHYSIVLANSGTSNAATVVLTDALPGELTYVGGTLAVQGGGLYGESGGVITWTGGVNVGSPVLISFDATVSESLTPGVLVTNTAAITGTGELLLRQAVTEIISEPVGSNVYLPIVYRAPSPPTLNPIPYPNTSNAWTVSWTWEDGAVPEYELQEATNSGFVSAVTYNTGSTASRAFSHAASFTNRYYYRVRVIVNGLSSDWSNVQSVVGHYNDEFSNPTSGWAIRRQDTDDVDNSSRYESGWFVLEIDGRWDYAIAAPMAPAPALPYQIKTRVRWHEPKNLNSYGLIVGGDWDGRPCPVSDYSSCFNHYYRINIIWHGAPNSVKVDMKRIDYHDAESNVGRGVRLWGTYDVYVPDPQGWNEWTVEVRADRIKLYANGNHVFTVFDSTYVNDPYFGVFASTDEYLGSEPQFDWYRAYRVP